MRGFVFLSIVAAAAATSCRCFPGDACWPTLETWQQFNKSVDGRLIATVPLGLSCHDPHYDEELCAQLAARWTIPELQYVQQSFHHSILSFQ
jgi:hypothetical protein